MEARSPAAATQNLRHQSVKDGDLPSVDIELVIAVDVSYSMDIDELAVQREGYAQAIVSREFLQALKTGPMRRLAVTYFEWSASGDQKIIILSRLIDGPESADAVAAAIMQTTVRQGHPHFDFPRDQFRIAAVRRKSVSRVAACDRYFR